MAYISLDNVGILYGNVLGKNIVQAISVYEPMKIETEYNNEALSKRCFERNEMKCPSLSVPSLNNSGPLTVRMSTFSALNKFRHHIQLLLNNT